MEVFNRWTGQKLAGFEIAGMKHSFWSLTGWTSFWMLPIGGLCGLFGGWLNETNIKFFKIIRTIGRAFLGAIFTLVLELGSGLILNTWLKLGIWDYSQEAFNIAGQICLTNGIKFLLVMPLAFWLDDILRYLIYDEKGLKGNIFIYYKNFITFK